MSETIPNNFRKMSALDRMTFWNDNFFNNDEEKKCGNGSIESANLSDVLIENTVGVLPLPLGISGDFLIDGKIYNIPMATEEPSVIAAASYGAKIVSCGGGFFTEVSESIMETYIYLENVSEDGQKRLSSFETENEIKNILEPIHKSLNKRGGGYRKTLVYRLPQNDVTVVSISIDVKDAMGANILNTASEKVYPVLEKISGGKKLMCILSNYCPNRKASARFSIELEAFSKFTKDLDPSLIAKKIVLATSIANCDPNRAVTHNKGIMNGISAITQATLNDTRAVEASAYAYACRSGQMQSLSSYSFDGKKLSGNIELPIALGTVGGSIDMHPSSKAALKLLGNPDSKELAKIAVSLGLAQNLAAVLALVSTGIQSGHMHLHAARLAYKIGARGDQTRKLADMLSEVGTYTLDEAKELFKKL